MEIPGGLANSALAGSANPEIYIDSDGQAGTFVVTSIVIKTNVPGSGFQYLLVNRHIVDGTLFDTRTQNLVTALGSAVRESADLMGAPIRVDSLGGTAPPTGGTFPSEIVAENAGVDDIRVTLFARSDLFDMDIETVAVCGWKRPKDTISVSYVPGS